MSLFKKRREKPALLYSLDIKLQETIDKGDSSFYYPLEEKERLTAQAWATSHHIMMEPDHITDSLITYKFWGIST